MLRRLVLAAVSLVLLSGCGGGLSLPSVSIPSDPDNDRLVEALTAFVGTLERGEYAAAAALGCAEIQPEADLRAEFEPHPRPWKQFVTYTSRGDTSGNANLDLTPSGAGVLKYTFDLNRLADGSWQVCDVSRGSIQVDVD
ncbi:hypothetical protein [Virgisporangium ochraceum]|uniref:Lipoprotein n=1 Tax=Virgisporangium ochraceum TaxID=65505 RepID=A0A8J3ZTP5_9ACTN|nr:hypothetical protein [Virgisporangium ochraceum]GIJ68812.1 hypothetical protein Voc01_037290 [Virgisporangium ochraceum]